MHKPVRCLDNCRYFFFDNLWCFCSCVQHLVILITEQEVNFVFWNLSQPEEALDGASFTVFLIVSLIRWRH